MPVFGEDSTLDEDAKKGALKLKAHLAEPGAFEKWANEALDMSRLRTNRRATKMKKKSAK
jgi:hypothetical protein